MGSKKSGPRTAATVTLLGLLLATLVAACTRLPDLQRLYRLDAAPSAQSPPPVILVPGLLGSRLRERSTGREIWPGSPIQALLGNRQGLALNIDPATLEPIDDDVEAYALFDRLLGADFYARLRDTLEQAGGYRLAQPGVAITQPGRRYYVFPYDWRQDNVRSAQKLDALIEQIRRDHRDPALKVDVVAHSMGGLILRYYLRYGARDVLGDNELRIDYAGVAKVRAAILLGTPNLGSVNALHGFITGTEVGYRAVPPEVAATLPSTYQLFPHPLHDWLVTADGRALARDLYEPQIWRAFQWSVFDPAVRRRVRERYASREAAEQALALMERYFEHRLQRARRFVWSITRQLDESPERLIVFGGNCEPTPARLLVEEIDGESMVRLRPQDVVSASDPGRVERAMVEPGDGVVTKASLLGREQLDSTRPRHRYAYFPLAWSLFLCESHSRLTGNPSFQDNLLDALLSYERRFDQHPVRPQVQP